MALFVAGCGASESAPPTPTAASTGTSAKATSTATLPSTSDAVGDQADATATPLGRTAVARGAHLEALVVAYRPVTARASFVVAAETLRARARSAASPAAQLQQHARAVQGEIRASARVLVMARRAVAASPAPDAVVRRIQLLMLRAIGARARAIVQLGSLVRADAVPTTTNERRSALQNAWRQSWDASVRAARDATTVLQDARDVAGLQPAPEDSIR